MFLLSLEHYPLPESIRNNADFFTQISQGANAIFVSVVCIPAAAHAVDTDEDCSTLQTRSSSTLRTTLTETCEKIDGDSGVGWSIGTTTDIQGGNVPWAVWRSWAVKPSKMVLVGFEGDRPASCRRCRRVGLPTSLEGHGLRQGICQWFRGFQ